MSSKEAPLKVSIVSARKLAGRSVNAYAEVMLLDKKGQKLGKSQNSKVIRSNDPKWGDSLSFTVAPSSFSGLMVRCWDKHTFRRDGFLGQVTIKINTAVLEGESQIDDWFTLKTRGARRKETVSGDVMLKIQYGKLKKKGSKKSKGSKKEKTETEETDEPSNKQLKVSKNWDKAKLDNKTHVVVDPHPDDVDYDSEDEDANEESYSPRRTGPPACGMVKINNSKVSLSNKDLDVQNTSSSYSNECARSSVGVNSGKWYFEVKLASGSQFQVGWCTNTYDGKKGQTQTGDSWTYDITRQQSLRKGVTGPRYGDYCYSSDTIGVALDVESKTIKYYRNNKDLGVAFSDVSPPADGEERFYPYVSLPKNTKARLNFGKDGFTCGADALRDGYTQLHSLLTLSQVKSLGKLFNTYKAKGIDLSDSAADAGDVIQGNGSLAFQEDIGVTDDDDPLLMIVAWKLDAEIAWEFSRGEWMDGFTAAGVYTIKMIKEKANGWKKTVDSDKTEFKRFYYFVFDYLKGDKRILDIDTAELVWGMVLKPRGWQLFDKWIEFLKKKEKKAISKDAWQQLVEFTETYPKDLSNYDEMAAWPLLFDEFVEYMTGGDENEETDDPYDY
eukprot:TRINITY_DN8338_c0_g1_i1.p1 TRINITY_DN8338_c0_g1~~TRINITY_DN8338_c0_g1_i1.p1  ORF type:complete len:612 (+),score=120.40 TRINITY_DN8338_c0_g1_i1:20-1855(+)